MRPIIIFISGTIDDMEFERNIVELLIKKDLGFDCIRAETRGSTSNTPIRECKKMVEECDIYIGLYGKRYGYKFDGKKSVTEQEYDWAENKLKLIYIKKLADDEFETDQLRFLKRVTNFEGGNFRSAKFENAQELISQIKHDLINKFIIQDYLNAIVNKTEEWQHLNLGHSINITQNYVTHRIGKEYNKAEDPPIGKSKLELFFSALNAEREVYKDLQLLESICLRKLENLNSFIIGNPGCGKTTMMNRWANYLAKDMLNEKKFNLTPILMPLNWVANFWKNTDSLPSSITGALCVVYNQYDSYYKALQKKLEDTLKSSNCILLLDGLDEVSVDNRSILINWIEDQKRNYPDCPIVITTRPAAYQGGISSFQEFEVLPFNEEQIDHFINAWFKEDSEKCKSTLSVVSSNSSIRRLSKTPLLLSLFCTLVEKNRVKKDSLAQKEYYLFDSCITLLLEEWDQNKGIGEIDRSGSKFRININDKNSILKDVGLHFYSNEEIIFDRSSLSERIEKYLSQVAPEALENRQNIDNIINDIEMNSGIIKRLSTNYYSFFNKTFHEYFTTKELIYRALNNGSWLDILASNFWNQDWSEVSKMFISALPDYTINLLRRSFEFLPQKWGEVVELNMGSANKLIIVLEDNYVNWGARLNQARLLKPIGYSRCINLINSAGASGLVDTTSVSSFPDLDIRVKTAYLFLKSLELTAEEYCSIVSDWDVKILGIENEKLYFEQQAVFVKAYEAELAGDAKEELKQRFIFAKLHAAVPQIYVNNTLQNMNENNCNVSVLAGAAEVDVLKICHEIKKHNISYCWIRAKEEGVDDPETFHKLHTKWRLPVKELLKILDTADEIPVL